MESSELRTLSCKVPHAVHSCVVDLAEKEGLTLSEYLRRLIVTSLRSEAGTSAPSASQDRVLQAAATRLASLIMADIPREVVVKLAEDAVLRMGRAS
jgi:hypothetical protein